MVTPSVTRPSPTSATYHCVGAEERLSSRLPSEPRHASTSQSHESTNWHPPPKYLPLSNIEPSTSGDPRTSKSDPRTGISATIRTDTPTPASRQEARRKSRRSSSVDPALGKIRSGGEVESDVLAVEEICRQLGHADMVRHQTGFGCPLANLSRADGRHG